MSVPKLRFPGFKNVGEWENVSCDEIFSERIENGFSNLALLSLTDKEGIIPQSESNRKNNSGSDKAKYLRILPGDIAYNTMRMWEGRCALVDREGIVSPAYTVCKPKKEIVSSFFFYYFKTEGLIRQFHKYSQGLVKDTLNLKFENFQRIPVFSPSLPEQKKIADCLSSLDDLIAAHKKKIDILKTHKSGLMQQLFPSEGETVPHLRFPDFENEGEWEFKELQDFSTIIRGASPRPQGDPRYFGGSVPRLMGKDVTRDGKWVTPCIDFLTAEGAELSRFCKKGTLTIICSGDVGVPSFLAIDACIHDGFLALVDINEEVIQDDFLFYSLSNLQTIFSDSATHGGVFINLTTTILKEFCILTPSLPEQQKIADCLSSIDAMISAQTEKIESLTLHKKGLMQQLFPKGEA